MERQHAVALAGRALGKERGHRSRPRAAPPPPGAHDAQRIALALRAPSMNKVPPQADQPAEQRPVPHVGLGDEARPAALCLWRRMSSQETWFGDQHRRRGVRVAADAAPRCRATRASARPAAHVRTGACAYRSAGEEQGGGFSTPAVGYLQQAAEQPPQRAQTGSTRCARITSAGSTRGVGRRRRCKPSARPAHGRRTAVLALGWPSAPAGSNRHRSATPPDEAPHLASRLPPAADHGHRLAHAHAASRQPELRRPQLQCQAGAQFEPGRAGSACANGRSFASRRPRVVADQRVAAARRDRSVAVALLRSGGTSCRRLEVPDVQIGQAHWSMLTQLTHSRLGAAHRFRRRPRSTGGTGARARRCRASPARSGAQPIVSAATALPARPSRVASAPLAAHALPELGILRAQPDGVAEGRRVGSARISTSVSASGALACEKPMQPAALTGRARSAPRRAGPASTRRAEDARAVQLAGAEMRSI